MEDAVLTRYRVMAYVTAVLLIVLVFVAVPLQVAGHPELATVVGTASRVPLPHLSRGGVPTHADAAHPDLPDRPRPDRRHGALRCHHRRAETDLGVRTPDVSGTTTDARRGPAGTAPEEA